MSPPICREFARQLCEQIQRENRLNWETFDGLLCWGCVKFANGEFDKMSVSNQPDCRGCILVNMRYDALVYQI